MTKKTLNVSVDDLVRKVGKEDIADILERGRTSELKTLLDKTQEQIAMEETASKNRSQFCFKAGPLLTVKAILKKVINNKPLFDIGPKITEESADGKK